MKKIKQKNTVKKRKIKKRVVAAICLFVAAVLIIVPTLIFRNKGTDFKIDSAIVQSYEVTKGNVSTTISSTGTLANADAESIEIPEGIKIKKVYVNEGDSVEEGQELALVDKASAAEIILDIDENIDTLSDELEDVDASSDKTSTEYMQRLILKNSIKDLKSEKKKLMQIYKSGKITASSAGIVDTVNVTDDATVSGQNSGSADSAVNGSMLSSDKKTSSGITLLSSDVSGRDSVQPLSQEMNDNVTLITNADMSALRIQTPASAEAPQSEIEETHFYTGKISWDTTGSFESGKTYTATIILTAKYGYAFAAADSYNILNDSSVVSKELALNQEAGVSGNELGIRVSYMIEEENQATEPPSAKESKKTQQSTVSDNVQSQSDVTGSSQSTKNNNDTDTAVTVSASSSSTEKSSDDTTESNIDISQVEIFAISPSDSMVLSVSVDELDINSVKCGQNAVITMDAFENNEFSGTISNIDTTATTNGGSSKYTVDITLNKEEGMLQGMSASAVININEADDVILIPANAISERGGDSFVYTEKSEEGQLSGEVLIQTGLSDGTNVEVTEGLSEGDTIYYTVINSQDESGGMGGFGMPGDNRNFGNIMNQNGFQGDMPMRDRTSDSRPSGESGGGRNWNQ